jgi:DNA-binding transcriptional LysR family regulator
MTASISWDDFRLIKAIADGRSLVAAASALGLNHSTVFRRLGQLEKDLGVRLFDRSRTGYAPTSAGNEMIDLAARMASEIVDFERRVAGRDVKPAGDLRITTNDTFLMHLLIPIVAGFRKLYPDIRLEVIISNEALNLSKRDADIAIRATDDPPENLVGRRIATFAFAAYAPARFFTEKRAFDERDHDWIGYGEPLAQIPAGKWLAAHVPAERIVYRSNTILGQAEAVAAGIGIGLLPCFIAEQRADLVRFGEPIASLDHGLWLLTHPDLRNAARVRAFMDYAGTELAKFRRICEGQRQQAEASAMAGANDEPAV